MLLAGARYAQRMGGISNWDFSFLMTFLYGESRSLEFRTGAFDFFNQHQFNYNEQGSALESAPSGPATGTDVGPSVLLFAMNLLLWNKQNSTRFLFSPEDKFPFGIIWGSGLQGILG